MLGSYKYTDKEKKEILSSMTILVDSRENKNSHITDEFDKNKIKWKTHKLDFGDYSFYVPSSLSLNINRDLYFCNNIAIERKNSLSELSQNLAQNRDQFNNEFLRASRNNCKIILMLENSSYSDIVNHKYSTEFNPQSFIASLFSFQHKYNFEITYILHLYSWHYIYKTFYYYLFGTLKEVVPTCMRFLDRKEAQI